MPNRIRHCACGCAFVFRKHYRTGDYHPIETDVAQHGTVALLPDGTFRPIGPYESYLGPRYRVHAQVCRQVHRIRPQPGTELESR